MNFNLPNVSKLFLKEKRDSDLRGEILSIVDTKIQNVSIISSNANVIRSNHYHKKDFHFMYVLEGKIDYFFKETDNKDHDTSYIEVNVGETIFTPNLEIHCTYFPIRTTLVVSSYYPRDQVTYEKDTVRVDYINYDNLDYYLNYHAK